jgi:hypothetical protein
MEQRAQGDRLHARGDQGLVARAAQILDEHQEVLDRRDASRSEPADEECRPKIDPESGNLDRVQIIKGYLGGRFNDQQEKIYDVALSDGRTVDPKTGKVKPVGNTVDVKNATYTNDLENSQLAAVWTDPDFDPHQPAVYYVRVLEIPTPRWTTYDAKKLGVAPPEGVPTSIQERAWSSPIWYTPAAK